MTGKPGPGQAPVEGLGREGKPDRDPGRDERDQERRQLRGEVARRRRKPRDSASTVTIAIAG